ncbi:DUF2500 domain-containing protein [Bacillus salipaludis]|uniref:DUF2500 domain-containing protein n=1 Tax=Bacillus salipaludis TaxID=2547811 RepID=A0A4R5W0W6_9BACI|nr:DUF2500 domain-containing protein [Bacillus salipaludis]MDQ6597063.1 DUF2500 domain-containing protein [Bacillus salipaludis]TDK64733.1 DUF2500 domain-containing protein [Bacillus salipaludis]
MFAGDFMFQFAPIFIGVIFIIVISTILFTIVKGITQWNKNNHSPKLNVNARVVAKRTAVRGGGETRAHSDYFVTFEVESGDRMELEVKDDDFGMLVEGDQGELTFQGTRYLGFIRSANVKEVL